VNIAIVQLNQALTLILPDVVVLATVCLMFFAAPFLVSDRGEAPAGLRHRWGWLALVGLGTALGLWWQTSPQPVTTGPFRLDELAWLVRGINLAGGLLLVLVNWNQAEDNRAAETQASLLAIVAGVNLVAAANDLVGLFVALELISIPTYLFLLLPRRDAPAQEATIKYFLLSAFSSALVLFGLSYLYGATGTTNLEAIYSALRSGQAQPMPGLLAVAAVMLIAGLGFRLTAVPFHFYAPDVFQGAPTSAAAMLAFVPKIAGFVALYRVLGVSLGIPVGAWSLGGVSVPLLWWLAVLTMFTGNLLALLQTDIRRLLAYSSVSHAGYMLVGFVVGANPVSSPNGIEALFFYLAVYGVMTLGAFAALAALRQGDRRIETIDDLAGLSRTRPGIALMLAVFLFSLTGLPPTVGFLGKLNLFLAAWSQNTDAGRWLAIWLAMNAAIGAWYYLKVVAAMYLRDPVGTPESEPETPALVAVTACTLATLGLFFAPGWLWDLVQRV
jgi:NADH-quinone oxidoreductase subunit N